MSDEAYAYGKVCTWHGPLTFASYGGLTGRNAELYCCPKCGRELHVTTVAVFWRTMRMVDGARPGHEAMWRWSEGKCFADLVMLRDAYQEATEGEQ